MRYESIHMRVDLEVLHGDDAFAVIAPVWWTANIYRGPGEYEASLAEFTPSQRWFFAIWWYRAEVNNGGHDQFYRNPTGIVWQDALAGFESLRLVEFAAVLQESAQRLGGAPPLEREEREEVLARLSPAFADLDSRFYQLEQVVDLDAHLLKFAGSHPEDFAFDGVVRQAVL
jgi:Domain of unknown function (DUF4375)